MDETETSRVDQTERGTKEKTGGIWIRRSQRQTSHTGQPEITVCQDVEGQWSASVHQFLAVTMLQEGNLTTNESCQIYDGMLSPFLPIGYIVICCIGLLCNTVTLYIFFLRRHADSSMAVYMRHLALADTLLVMCLPLRVYYHNKEGPFYLCKVVGIFFYVNMYSSILFLSLISLDRYLKIIKPVWVFRIQKTKWSHMACYIIWVILISGMIPFLSRNSQKHPCDKICFHFHSKGLVVWLAQPELEASVMTIFLPGVQSQQDA
ncbi:hypothetical protein Q8A67_023003 [Cirrhinus molitorella]|uniref:G-protein coupled receptors family 1 profile domain-containing protein n=1 Tax=Cirrhinus molitorella TaxID=172907 RepID=A0AA88TBJ3_9TELE|nr:hypothetical protein Q8A67_023003 [Cirrhinus molitorella]